MTERCASWPAALALLLLLACDIPTGTPDWDLMMLVPGDSTSMAVGQLLPSKVSITADKTAFLLSFDPVTFRRTLGQMCSACGAAQGFTVPKPAFSFTFTDQVNLPADVASASVASGTVEIRITNNFNFDPLRPSATNRGSITARLLHATSTLSADTIRGATTAFPPGTTLIRTLTLRPATLTGSITVEISVTSPDGDPVQMETAPVMDVRATPQNIRVSEARVGLSNKNVSVDEINIDLDDIDDAIKNRAGGGGLVIDMTNPFDVTGTLTLRISPSGGGPITKSLSVRSGTTSQRVTLSRDELRSILGKTSRFGASGAVSAAGGTLTVRPTQILVVKSKLELTLSLKER